MTGATREICSLVADGFWRKLFTTVGEEDLEEPFASRPFLEALCSYCKDFRNITCSPEDISTCDVAVTMRELAMLTVTVRPNSTLHRLSGSHHIADCLPDALAGQHSALRSSTLQCAPRWLLRLPRATRAAAGHKLGHQSCLLFCWLARFQLHFSFSFLHLEQGPCNTTAIIL